MNQQCRRYVLSTIAALAVVACESPSPPAVGQNAIVEIEAGSTYLGVGGTLQLTARVRDDRGRAVDAAVTWTTSDATIAGVSASGLVTGVAEGSAEVTAATPTSRATTRIVVMPVAALTPLVNFDAAGNRLTRFDVNGNAIDAHGGEIRYFDGAYYWYGEHYACGFQWITPGTPFCGFRVYSSPDLVHWTDHGSPFALNSQWEAWCDGRTNGCFRPHVAYNPNTKRYVLWFNSYDADGGYWMFESSSPVGPFEHRGNPRLAIGVRPNRGDANLFVDTDGRGYLAYTHWLPGGDIIIEELERDFLNGSGRHVVLGLTKVEAPALFRRGDRYYLTVSDPNCGYCTTGTSYLTATSPLGPWSGRRKISTNSCGGQPSHVAELPAAGGGSWYMYMSDLWNAGELNQATADQYWAPLAFDAAGEILPLRCEPAPLAPVRRATASPPVESSTRFRLTCDIGNDAGRVQRELRFTPTAGGRLRALSLNLYQRGARNAPERGSPDAPLVIEVRAMGSDSVRARVEVAPMQVAWSAQQLSIPLDVPVLAGERYALRLQSAASRGCYGLAYRDDLPVPVWSSHVSRDRGATWIAEGSRTIRGGIDVR